MNRGSLMLGLSLAAIATATYAQPYAVDWHTVDGGGAISSTGGSYELAGTIGQPDAGIMIGGSYQVTGGFWPVVNACYCLGDMNGDGKKDGSDIQNFVTCILVGGSCACADEDAMNGVTIDDVDDFVSDLLSGSDCP